MNYRKLFLFLSLVIPSILLCTISACKTSNKLNVSFNPLSATQQYAFEQLSKKHSQHWKISNTSSEDANIVIASLEGKEDLKLSATLQNAREQLVDDGFQIIRDQGALFVLGKTDRACLYGVMDISEQLQPGKNLSSIEEKIINPTIPFRAIKFNLPWSPYRPGPATDIHLETCKDLKFWEAFLDMMVENRFNALSLWNKHPFPFMIRAKNYPEAPPFNEQELKTWQSFWKELFAMAKVRGIETYIVNWNIVVSPSFAETYGAEEHFDRSELVKKYTKESVTQLIDEYDDLTGLGVTLADWMGNWGDIKMTSLEREEWIEDTFVAGMKDAKRKVKFIHRAVLAGDPMEMRKVTDKAELPDKTIVEIKFNWSHAYSTPNLSITHANDDGSVMQDFWNPKPTNYFIAWMMRNEDFFVLRWGDPDFIKSHLAINNKDYVEGYFVGSEGYIPAVDYSHKGGPAKTWQYAFEKQWLFYKLWGRLLYNIDELNRTFESEVQNRFGEVDTKQFMKAYSLASKVPQEIASFFKGTWDFTLYTEGFLAPWIFGHDDGQSPFISLEEIIDHETLDKNYLSIKEYANLEHNEKLIEPSKISPIELADNVENRCLEAINILAELSTQSAAPNYADELADLETWCHLGLYFADKVRAGVHLASYRINQNETEKQSARKNLENCIKHWKEIIRCTEARYQPMPYVSMGNADQKWPAFKSFHWKDFLEEVERDLKLLD